MHEVRVYQTRHEGTRWWAADRRKAATAPMGLEYHADFLDASQEYELLARIDDAEWLTDLSRRVMHFGYKYDYTSRRLDETARIGPLPEWLAQLSNRVREAASEEAKQLLDPRVPVSNRGQRLTAPLFRLAGPASARRAAPLGEPQRSQLPHHGADAVARGALHFGGDGHTAD